MRKLIATENVSLDGVMESPETWAARFQGPDFHEAMGEGMAANDTMIFGRVTFQEFAAFWPDSDIEPFASYMNGVTKYVASNSLTNAEWGKGNTVPIIGKHDLKSDIQQIKEADGANIGIIGSGGLVRWLLSNGLIDELHLCVYPLLLGSGKKLFSNADGQLNLKLTRSRDVSNGIVLLTYEPLKS